MEQTIPRPEFPRPDFVRNEWEILNGTWEFSFEEPVFDRQIQVPFLLSVQYERDRRNERLQDRMVPQNRRAERRKAGRRSGCF